MEFLANENFPFPSIKILRACNIAVHSISEEYPGISDTHVIQLAIDNDFIILTFDRDYGELIFKYASSAPPTVVYFRNKGKDADFAGKALLQVLSDGRIPLKGRFTVIDKDSIRQRKYQ